MGGWNIYNASQPILSAYSASRPPEQRSRPVPRWSTGEFETKGLNDLNENGQPSKPPLRTFSERTLRAPMAGYLFWRETDTYPPMRNKILGVALVLAGATCYGVLSVFIKTAYTRGYTPSEILISQFSVAIVLLAVIEAIRRRKPVARVEPLTALRLVAGGTAIGLVGIFYYLTIQYSSVSAAIVLLMQSV